MVEPVAYCNHCDIYWTYENDHDKDCAQYRSDFSVKQLTFGDFFDMLIKRDLFQGATTSFDIQWKNKFEKLKRQWSNDNDTSAIVPALSVGRASEANNLHNDGDKRGRKGFKHGSSKRCLPPKD